MTKWQYKTIIKTGDNIQMDKILNPLGKEGWELVCAFFESYKNNQGAGVLLVFKRPIARKSPRL